MKDILENRESRIWFSIDRPTLQPLKSGTELQGINGSTNIEDVLHHTKLAFHDSVRIFMMLGIDRSVLRQVEHVFKTQFHVIPHQDLLSQVGCGNSSSYHGMTIQSHSPFCGKFHGKATAVQTADFFVLVSPKE
jgi:hypothetical protein